MSLTRPLGTVSQGRLVAYHNSSKFQYRGCIVVEVHIDRGRSAYRVCPTDLTSITMATKRHRHSVTKEYIESPKETRGTEEKPWLQLLCIPK